MSDDLSKTTDVVEGRLPEGVSLMACLDRTDHEPASLIKEVFDHLPVARLEKVERDCCPRCKAYSKAGEAERAAVAQGLAPNVAAVPRSDPRMTKSG